MALKAGYGVVLFLLLLKGLVLVNCLAAVSVRRGMPEPYVLSFRGQDEEGHWDLPGNGVGSTTDPTSGGNPDSSQSESSTSHSYPDLTDMYWDQPVDLEHDEVIQMTVSNLTFSAVGGANLSRMPGSVELSFNYAGHLIRFSLTRNDNIPSHAPVFFNSSTKDSSYVDRSKFQDYAFYYDPNYMSSVLIEKVHDDRINSTVYLYSGSFHLNGVEFGFEPASQPSGAHRRKRRSVIHRARRDVSSDGPLQIVYQKTQIPADPLETRYEPYLNFRFNDTKPPELQFDLPTGKTAYLVEILAVIDYRLYVRWYNLSKASDSAKKTEDATNNIRFYFGHIFNGVDMRYRSINNSAFSISTSLVGLYIAKKPSDVPFVESYRQNATVDANAVLTSFISWLTTSQGQLPQFDQATLFTSESLLGSVANRISGLAIIKGVCSRYSVAICKDAGEYATTQTATHEIGHNLGAGHDGVDNSCHARDLYIMSAFPGLQANDTYKNSFHFSSCSVSEFSSFLGLLSVSTSAGDQCLLQQSKSTLNLTLNLGEQPGQRYTPDDQCVLMFGPGSYYCGGKTEDARICRTMECFNPQLKYCYATYEQRAFTRTTCGNQSWCQLGDCVFDEGAPVNKSECIYGDYKGPYTNGLTCNMIVSSAPWNCYDPAYSDDCCVGCAAIRNDSRVGCEFGDHEGSCYTMGLFGCYDDALRARCCNRCKNWSNVSGCEYGDKAEWCPSFIKIPLDCYSYSSTCCDSCKKYDTRLPDCRYGDRAGWCSSMSRAYCYTSAYDCCYTCSQLYNSSAVGCEYGDKAGWCSGRQGFQCYLDGATCCETCKNFITNISGCEYGDKLLQCSSNLQPADCYTLSTYCCATCSNYHTGISDCEYGDRVESCSLIDCVNPLLRADCCFTCHNTTGISSPNITVTSSPLLPATAFSSTSAFTSSVLTSATTTTLSLSTTTLPSTVTILSTKTQAALSSPTTVLSTISTLPSTTTTLPSTTTTASTTTTTIPSITTTTTTVFPTRATTTITRLLSTTSVATLNLSPLTVTPTSQALSITSMLIASPSGDDSQSLTTMRLTSTVTPKPPSNSDNATPSETEPANKASTRTALTTPSADQTLEVSVMCVSGDDRASYCTNMPIRDCYVLADTCCRTCRESYMRINGCEYGNRAGWCDGYVRDRAGCLRNDNAFWCCKTCATIYGVQCTDSVNWCNMIRPWDCYDNLLQATSCCATCRRLRKGNRAGCEYGDKVTWCKNYPLSFVCSTSRPQCCKTCLGWQ